MSKFAYFNPHDGRILQLIDTDAMNYNMPDASMLHTCSDAEWDVLHHGEWMVKDGSFIPYATPAPDLVQIKSSMWDAIKAKRDAISTGGVKVGTKWYHSDESSRGKYLGLVRIADAAVVAGGVVSTTLQYGGQDIQWKTMDGTFIKMTTQRANDVFAAASGLDFAAFGAAETHKAAMEASADPASYDYSGGWPKIYGE